MLVLLAVQLRLHGRHAPVVELADATVLGAVPSGCRFESCQEHPHYYKIVGGMCMYTCKCGRSFEKVSSYGAHCSHCRIHLGHEPKDPFGDKRAWSRGLTKETDPRVANMAKHLSEKFHGENTSFYGKHHTEETKRKMSESARRNAKNHINGWKSGDCRVPNKYEAYTYSFLEENGISFQHEVSVSKKSLGCDGGSRYMLDFVVNGVIDLEIDGTAHNKEYDDTRDSFVKNKYIIYRIQHHDSIDELYDKLREFVCWLNNMDI